MRRQEEEEEEEGGGGGGRGVGAGEGARRGELRGGDGRGIKTCFAWSMMHALDNLNK